MATYHNSTHPFASLEIIERLLELRAEAGFRPMLFLRSPADLATTLDVYGFEACALQREAEFSYGQHRVSLAWRGDRPGDFESTH